MKKLTATILAIVTLVLLAAGVVAISARGALKAIERQSDDILGLAIEVEGYSVSWYRAALSLRGIRIYPAGRKGVKSELLASADEMSVRIMPSALLRKTLHASSVTLENPTINLIERRRNDFNWGCVDLSPAVKEEASTWDVWVEDVRIDDGTLLYHSRPEGHRVRLTDLSMSIRNIKSDADPDELPTKLSIKSKIDGDKGTLRVKGRLNAFAEGVNFHIRSLIDGAPITYFRSFYEGQTPFPVRSGRLGMSTKAEAKKSQLVAHSTATIHDLRVGGNGVKGKLVNAYLKTKRGPVVVKVTVKGDLEKGNFSTASALSRGIGDGIFAQASDANPLRGTGEKLKEGTQSVGRKIKGLFGR